MSYFSKPEHFCLKIILALSVCLVFAGSAVAQDPPVPGDSALPAAEDSSQPEETPAEAATEAAPDDTGLQPPNVTQLDENADDAVGVGDNAAGEPILPGGAQPPALPLGPGPGVSFDEDSGAESAEDFAASQAQAQEQMRRGAFDAALRGLLPLRPQEIRELLEHFDRTQESVELPVYPPPRPEMVVQTINLDPGSSPLVVKTAYGYVTTVSFLDASGSPWPIKDVTWAGNFDIVQYSQEGGDVSYGYILRITPQSEFAYGNMSVSMIALKTPIIMSIEASRDVVHYRFDAVIPQTGPMASTPLIQPSGIDMAAGDVDASLILEGSYPRQAVKMDIAGVDGRTSAYRMNGVTYLRTPLTLLSPAWISSVASADGTRVYTLRNSPVLLLSENGKVVRAHLSDREDISNE